MRLTCMARARTRSTLAWLPIVCSPNGRAPSNPRLAPLSHTLRRVEMYMTRLPLVRPFTTSSHTKHHLEHILIRVRDQDGADGWGECATASDPYYCSETSETSWHILRDFLIPGLLGQP